MKENYEICLVGERCVLVPYRPSHVERYHEWMQSPELLEATGSEPLSLAEEYEMQQSWKLDEKKCTFIVLDKQKCDMVYNANDDELCNSSFVERNIGAMVGDVNLFLSEEEDEVEEEAATSPPTTDPEVINNDKRQPKVQAELDIMIAEDWARRKGIGKEATCLMIQYGTKQLNIERFFCKINQDNIASRKMFEQSLRFVECDYAACFQQYEYEIKRNINDVIDTILGESRELASFRCSAPDLEHKNA
eukprot:CAMPEP_0198150140 /NCGR_PEP_ID=MMETSP1443-20131203/49621_1 /TAXON_ID=186043 /ORGANISM="Entomoneis sp., Strain CCMP2396" /LENGTH=247 /DNA_ID=CAMNT_0043815361 /DNA_START=34 /DNA_END=777 /DNA_ORIENTATION=-